MKWLELIGKAQPTEEQGGAMARQKCLKVKLLDDPSLNLGWTWYRSAMNKQGRVLGLEERFALGYFIPSRYA